MKKILFVQHQDFINGSGGGDVSTERENKIYKYLLT